ncbi:MAG TPA: hypothetical protein DDZ81_25670 [Acetobacteraceae bacterium]|jgi:hypothetical protein|nr:hypothetical protein [Acetobacteraceae bacterium]
MSMQIAEVERPDSIVPDESPPTFDGTYLEPERATRAVRGIANAVFISVPFWGLVGFAIYMLR